MISGQLKEGVILSSVSGNKYIVHKLLGAGGQGEVYEVERNGKHFALKWYHKHMATPNQKRILENLISKGKPDDSFLWPEDLICPERGTSFGYIMQLRPSNFKSIVDLMKRKAEPSFYNLCKAAFNLTKGYQKLHEIGYSYRDISFGNVFFDPETGDVLICDNDNVSVNGCDDSAVYGTPRFMAPEIVQGKAKPSRNTDLYSLSVLLFYMLMMNHPLDGRLEANIRCMDIFAMNKLYGTDPVFIFDPNNNTNRPVIGYQDNAIIYWSLYPQKIKDLFIQAFTVGLTTPNRRVTENRWLDAFADLMSGIMICPHCGAEVFYDSYKIANGEKHICWGCNKVQAIPDVLSFEKHKIVLSDETKIVSHLIYNDKDVDTIIGSVVHNPNKPELIGVKNEDKVKWVYEKADGTEIVLDVGRSAAINKGAKIIIQNLIGVIE